MTDSISPLQRAECLADALLFPTAVATDAGDRVPRSHLDTLATAGLYGLFGPAEAGGLAVEAAEGLAVIEALAGGCLTTTFVWIQHHSALAAVATSATPGLRDEWLAPMCRGERRAGIAVAGIRPGAAAVTARAVAGGWRLEGDVPWVTGWGLVDVIHAAAIDPAGGIVWCLLDAVESASVTVQRLHLAAVDASVTVRVRFHDHFVPAERVTGVEGYDEWSVRDARRLRPNGSLALGVAGRCCRLLGPSPLDDEIPACRTALDQAAASDPLELPAARAWAAHLCLRAAGAVVVATGSRSVLVDQHPQRLAREAMFLLVFASRPGIREELVQRLSGRR